jgi:hypothetical protein
MQNKVSLVTASLERDNYASRRTQMPKLGPHRQARISPAGPHAPSQSLQVEIQIPSQQSQKNWAKKGGPDAYFVLRGFNHCPDGGAMLIF